MIWIRRYFWFKYDLGQKYHASQVRPDRGSNSWPPDHDSTVHVTETPALTTRPSVTSLKRNVLPHYLRGLRWFQMHGLSDRLMHWQLIFLVQVQLRTEVPHTPSSTRPGFELMTSRSWQYSSGQRYMFMILRSRLKSRSGQSQNSGYCNKNILCYFEFFSTFRYLYVNSRPWPKDAVIANPLSPPPIAQEIDIHVIDIVTMKQVGLMHRSHKAYTSDDECFFIFLDVCDEYVARWEQNVMHRLSSHTLDSLIFVSLTDHRLLLRSDNKLIP